MKKIIAPTKEELKHLYIDLKYTLEDLAFYYKCSKKPIKKWLKDYNITKSEEERLQAAKDVYMKKHGVATPFENKEVQLKVQNILKEEIYDNPTRMKQVQDHREKTMDIRYGVKNVGLLKSTQEKSKQKSLQKWGVDHYSKTEEYKQRARATNLLIRGVNYPMQSKEVQKKTLNTVKARYNVCNVAQAESVKAKHRETCQKKYHAPSYMESKISKESRDILNSKEKLESVINSLYCKTFIAVADKLDIGDLTAAKYIRKHGLEHLMDQHTSRPEQEIKMILSDIRLNKNRKILEGKEIDLYSEEHKIGIEFNGNYWHTEDAVGRLYHYNKSNFATKKGVFLFHIFEYEWNDPRTKQTIINRLRNIFNLNIIKIYARKCIIKDVPSKEAAKFLRNNHTQGNAPSQIRLGLYYKDELVALMEFITNGLNKKYQYELSRFCCKAGCSVVGGASKLFKHFLKVYNPKSVISYSDIAKTTGKLYETLGFTLESISSPQYHWFGHNSIFTHYQTRLQRLRKRGWLKEGETKSESQVMRERGFSKIYDCGKKVWTLFR